MQFNGKIHSHLLCSYFHFEITNEKFCQLISFFFIFFKRQFPQRDQKNHKLDQLTNKHRSRIPEYCSGFIAQ